MTKGRKDIEQEVTDAIMEALEAGTVPWTRPWTSAGILPTSATTGRPYRGINVWLLSLSAFKAGFRSPYWLTYNQARAFGGSVRKGERGTLVVFWKTLTVADNESADPDATKTIPLLRHYYVFNAEQTEGCTLPPRFQVTEREPLEPSEAITSILAGYVSPPNIRHHAQDRAYYAPATDTITLPALEQFDSEVNYSSTLFHELVHSTGHESRLNRFARNGEPQHFGSEKYAREELVAEMGAAMVAAIAGTTYSVEQSAAYVASWLRALKNDKRLVISAAQQAQKAVDRIVGTELEEEGSR